MSSHALNAASCLRALPAAMSLGVVLAHAANAQIIVDVSQHSMLYLPSGASGTPVSITAGTTIAPASGPAILGTTVAWTLDNAGRVQPGAGIGIELGAGGSITNSGGILGSEAIRLDAGGQVANVAGGLISGSSYGVLVENAGGAVTNSGLVTAGYDGVSLNHGGQVINNAGGTIFGAHIGVYTGYAAGEVTNDGVISARSGDAVSLYSGGNLTNSASGRIIGGYSGVYAGGNGASIQNAGLISGPDFGVYLNGASSVSNTGSIAGNIDGVMDLGRGGVLDNSGLIYGAQFGLRMGADADVQNAGTISGGTIGVMLGASSTLDNAATGLIQGGAIGLQAGDDDIISNAGTILDHAQAGVTLRSGDQLSNSGSIAGVTGIQVTGGNTSIYDTGSVASSIPGGNAIALDGGVNQVTLGTGALITGNIDGGGTASDITLRGTGDLSSQINNFGLGSALNIVAGADWTATGSWTIANVTNAGMFQPGLVGTPLSLDGNFTQTASGTLRIAVSPAGTAHFNISGAAQLAGNLLYVLAPGSYAPAAQTFISAGGGISGGFANVAPAPQAGQSGAQALAVVNAGGTLQLQVNQSFTVAPDDARLFADTTVAQALGAQQTNSVLLGHAGDAAGQACVLPMLQAGTTGTLAGAFCRAGGWVEALGGSLNATGAETGQSAGFLAGIDRRIAATGTKLGLAIGYGVAGLTDGAGGKSHGDATSIGLYAAQKLGAFTVVADVFAALTTEATSRQTGAGVASAQAHGHVLGAALQVSRPLAFAGIELLPASGLEIASITSGRLAETIRLQAFAVTAGASQALSVKPFIKLGIAKVFYTAAGIAITPQAGFGVSFEAANPGRAVSLAANDGTGFAATATHLAPFAATASLGLTVSRGNLSLSAHYGAQISGNWSAQTAQAELSLKF